MALKITTQIGTDKGITSEAYVRIADYQISKSGSANFRIELFQNQEDSISSTVYPLANTGVAKNQQIGDILHVPLTEEITETVITTNNIMNGEGVSMPTETTQVITKTIPDLSSAQGVDIFTFGYSHLKTKLVDLFGEANVVDC